MALDLWITQAQVEDQLRRYSTRKRGRLTTGQRQHRAWLLSVLGWMERTGRGVFTEQDAT